MKPRLPRLVTLLLLALLALGLVSTADAHRARTHSHRAAKARAHRTAKAAPATLAPAPAAPAPASAGMRAFIDPETGLVGGAPPVGFAPQDGDLVARSAVQPIEVILPDGSVMMDLLGTGEEYMIVQLDPAGRRVMRCVTDPARALTSVPTPAPAPQPEER